MPRRLLTNALRSGVLEWPADDARPSVSEVAQLAVSEGLHVLLLDSLGRQEPACGMGRELREVLIPFVREEAILDLAREQDLAETLAEFERAGVPSLILKGGALAHTHYEASHQRPRRDTDLLVVPDQVPIAELVLDRLGYRRFPGISGRLISHESTWWRDGPLGHRLQIDLHWCVSNSQGFANTFTFEELAARSRDLPSIGPFVRAPDDIHVLFVTAMHLIGNDRYGEGHKLLGLFDLHLICAGLDESAWEQVVSTATVKGLRVVLAAALARAQETFGAAVPEDVRVGLASAEPRDEPTAGYVGASRSRALVTDLRALPRWRDRARLLYEHVFPPAEYLRARLADSVRAPLWRLHVRRLFESRMRRGAR